jgi:hypothetical protein
MDAPLHANPPIGRLIPSVRTLALLTFGVGIGVVAALPLGGGTAIAAIVAILAATAAAAVALLRPRNPAAVVVADVLLGLAVIATVFGRLGLLYLPLLIAFLAVTARIDRTPERSDATLHWEPAPEFEAAMPASIAAPPPADEPLVVGEPGIIEEPGAPADLDTPANGSVVIHVAAPPEAGPELVRLDDVDDVDARAEASEDATSRPSGRHRAPSSVRRAAAAAARAGRRVGEGARTGVGNIRSAITTRPPEIEPPDPAAEPIDDEEIRVPGAESPTPTLTERSDELDALRHEFEERELELVAVGKPWSSLTHRAYGELRYLPPPPPPPRPPRRRREQVVIDDADWETPTWKTLADD